MIMNWTPVGIAVILAVTYRTPLLPALERQESTEESFRAEVERIGKERGCYPRDFMPIGDYRMVILVCASPRPPEAVLFKSIKGRWWGARAIFPDLDYESKI